MRIKRHQTRPTVSSAVNKRPLSLPATTVIAAVTLVAGGKAVKAVAFFYRVMERPPFGDKFGFHPPQIIQHGAWDLTSLSCHASSMSRTVKSLRCLSYLQRQQVSLPVLWRLAENTKLPGQRIRTLFLTAQQVAWTPACLFSLPFLQVLWGLSRWAHMELPERNPELGKPNLLY